MEFDTYIFTKIAQSAVTNGNVVYTAVTKSNAYELFLAAQESLGNNNTPDGDRIAFCSYKFANLLKQDSSFMKYSDTSQDMIIKGILGECDGVKIVKVPKSRMPKGTSVIMTHPTANVAPKQLEDYKIHDNPPGISGWLVEGRIIYDTFTLNNKVNCNYFIQGEGLYTLTVTSVAGTASGDTFIDATPDPSFAEHTFKYKLGTSATSVAYLDDLSAWTTMTTAGVNVAASTNTIVQIAEVNAAGKAVAVGQATIVKKP